MLGHSFDWKWSIVSSLTKELAHVIENGEQFGTDIVCPIELPYDLFIWPKPRVRISCH
jgi:hypothetical protein